MSEPRNRALPVKRRTKDMNVSPIKEVMSSSDCQKSMAEEPIRSRNGTRVPPRRAPDRSGTAVASERRRFTPDGSPSRATATFLSAHWSMTESRKVRRPLSQPSMPSVSKTARVISGADDRIHSNSSGEGRLFTSFHSPVRISRKFPSPVFSKCSSGSVMDASLNGDAHVHGLTQSVPPRSAHMT